jgi:PAS domain-containing protein
MNKNKDKPTSSKNPCKQAEKRLRDKAGDVSGKAINDAQQLIHELEMQNDELRNMQQKLIDSRDKHHELYDFAPVGYFTLDEKALIRQVNLTGADFLGIQRSKLIDTKFSDYISPEYQDAFYFRRFIPIARRAQRNRLSLSLPLSCINNMAKII